MSSSNSPIPLGQLIPLDAPANRDATHVAIVPLIAAPGAYLSPGLPFNLTESGLALPCHPSEAIGAVDPFLKTTVRPGERFWGLLIPGSVTNLRHQFDHHAFPVAPAPTAEAVTERAITVEKPEDPEITRLREFAKTKGLSIDEIIDEVSTALNDSCRGCY